MVILGITPEKKQKGISPEKLLLILKIVTSVLGLGVLIGLYFLVSYYIGIQKKVDTLTGLSFYPNAKTDISQRQFLKDLESKTLLPEVEELYIDIGNQYKRTEQYYTNLQQPYQYLEQFFLLPPLNIWKDKYTSEIDETLIGQRYLQQNTYLDVNLISKWTDFFKNIGQDSTKNEIKSINVGNINEQAEGIFIMPIDVSFVAQTKRSFLLLIDKVSMTSNRQNIALLNEFMLSLWSVIKTKEGGYAVDLDVEDLAAMSAGTGSDQTFTGDDTQILTGGLADHDIGQKIYEWIYSGGNTFVTDNDIREAIKRTANCSITDEESACYFKFREKFRSLPALAYSIGLDRSNKTKELKSFFNNIPPMINVKSFTFQKQTSSSSNSFEGLGYEGKISIEVYGKSVSAEDVNQVATYLGSQCTNNTPLDPAVALAQLDNYLKQTTTIAQISNEKSKQLSDLRAVFVEAGKNYDGLSGFKKVVKLFELYRMLNENTMCIGTAK